MDEYETLPKKYQPITAWGYFWLQILFAIPILGTIFLIIFAIGHSNINVRNFARSYFCIIIIIIIGFIIFGSSIINILQGILK